MQGCRMKAAGSTLARAPARPGKGGLAQAGSVLQEAGLPAGAGDKRMIRQRGEGLPEVHLAEQRRLSRLQCGLICFDHARGPGSGLKPDRA